MAVKQEKKRHDEKESATVETGERYMKRERKENRKDEKQMLPRGRSMS